MPMLGKKQFSLAKALTKTGPDEDVFTVQHTKEQFRSKDEYEKRLELYKQSIWTCRCTGHTTLTHEEAWKSEQAASKTLKSQFQKCFEKPVLQIVHHSTDSLDVLNDQAWTKLHKYLIEGEQVTFKVNNGAKELSGTVIGISPSTEGNSTTSSKCSSPSSDKENNTEDKDKSPKKWSPPKLLQTKYSVKLDDGPIINSVPVDDLTRSEKPPPKDLVRLFIRARAVRSGTTATSPWVVDDSLVKMYALPSKFADFLLSPSKMAEAAKRAEELGKKRKRASQDGTAAKKLKLSDKDKDKDKKKAKKGDKLTPVSLNKKVKDAKSSDKKKRVKKDKKDGGKDKKDGGKSPKKSPKKSKEIIEVDDSSSDEEVSLAVIKKMKTPKSGGDSDSDVPLSNLATEQGTTPTKKKSSSAASTPNKKKKAPDSGKKKTPGTPKSKKSAEQKSPGKRKRLDSTDSDVPLSKLSPRKAPGTPTKSPGGKSLKEENEKTPTKKNKTAKSTDKSSEKRGRGRPKKGEEKSPAKPKKGMKQTTLLDLAKKSGKAAGSSTPRKSPAKPQTPLIVKKLMALNQDENRKKFRSMLKKAVQVLTPSQKKNLPSPIKEKIQHQIELNDEKKALEKMSEIEKDIYMQQKKAKQRVRMKEKMKSKMKEMRLRYEDRDLKLQPLPPAKLVPTPDNLPNEMFGDVAMVTEFISSYSGLLMPESEYPIYTDALMKALAGGAQGFAYLSRVLSVLLQTLLQDGIAEGYSEFKVPLSDIAVNPYTVSELVRMCLRRDDNAAGAADDGDDELEVPDSVIQQLETHEFFQLEVGEKLQVLRGLCLRVLATYSVQDYMEEKQREAIQLTKQKVTEMKGFNEKLKEKKQKEEEDKPSANGDVNGDATTTTTTTNGTNGTNGPAVTLNTFYGKKLDDSPLSGSPADSQEEDGDGMVSIVKKRRVMAAKAAQEKEQRDKLRQLQKEKEYEEEKQRRQREQFATKFKDGISLARTVLRHVPIGSDRHHDRYWMFTHTTPGLYIEKGWIGEDHVNYNPGDLPDDRAEEDQDTAPTTPVSSPTKEPGSPSKKARANKKKALVESTVPCCGQNLWFTFNSLKDLDLLLRNLHPQGIREAALKTEIKKRYQDITKAILGYQRNNLELRESDGQEEMLAGFKKELSEMELRLRNGGLGGVAKYSEWEAKLMNTTDVPTMGSCLLESQEAILDKFLQKFMKLPHREGEEDGVKKEKKEEEEEEEEDAESKDTVVDDKKLTLAERRLRQWKDSIANCSTLSRLHVLLSMMDSCIKWEKSAENAKCKICRKKGDDDRLLLCDDCNQAFHMYCLRPQLLNVPRGDWFCVSCNPLAKRRVPTRYAEDELDSDEEFVQHTHCEECKGEAGEEEGEELVACHKCPNVYHLDCHQPPLRRAPRGLWECNDCKNGVRRRDKKIKILKRKAANSRKTYKADDSENDDTDDNDKSEEESPEEESEEEEAIPKFAPKRPKPASKPAAKPASKSTSKSTPKSAPRSASRSASKSASAKKGSAKSQSSRNSKGGSSSKNNTPASSRSTRHSSDNFYDDTPPRSRRAPSDLSLCEDILQRLMKHPTSWPFLDPVNKKEVPDYHTIIKKPMDFQTMLKKCARLSYSSPQEFMDDAILVFSNAAKYNQPSSDVYTCMKDSEKFFSELLAKYLPDYASTQTFVSDRDETSARSRRARRN